MIVYKDYLLGGTTVHALQAQEQVINQTLNKEFVRKDFFVWLTVLLQYLA